MNMFVKWRPSWTPSWICQNVQGWQKSTRRVMKMDHPCYPKPSSGNIPLIYQTMTSDLEGNFSCSKPFSWQKNGWTDRRTPWDSMPFTALCNAWIKIRAGLVIGRRDRPRDKRASSVHDHFGTYHFGTGFSPNSKFGPLRYIKSLMRCFRPYLAF